ncbi:hypothetical protein [Corynebacterium accolens]|uniref:hypothetical protein n=1 Tax=Corynebacterium accolens TaxID=38284 RepID=UPI00223BC019|nr:hypothetical protein [Corynebacterium accolens]MCT1410021.1 hypothetical protein [Corynebacterium accolens]
MTWMTKDLTLDLLAIGQDFLRRCAEAINNQTEQTQPETSEISETSDNRHPADTVPETPQPQPQSEATAPTNEDLLPKAQTLLRSIVQAEGPDWVTGTLFPHFNVQSLTDVPADKLTELITMAQKHPKGD